MRTAFGRAMVETASGRQQSFSLALDSVQRMQVDCTVFLHTREEENRLLDSIELPEGAKVLDLGCGVGRHLTRIRETHPSVTCYGVDICDAMLDYCRQTFAEPCFFATSEADFSNVAFDLIMLMGNGLGLLGTEPEAKSGLARLVGSLSPTGYLLIEAGGSPFGSGYQVGRFTVDWQGHHDGPFTWGYADEPWVSQQLESLGCEVQIKPSYAVGGGCFFAIAQRAVCSRRAER